MTLYREITDEERRTWSASRYTTISAVPVEPDYDEAKDALDLIDAYLSIVRSILGIGEKP